MFWSTVSCRHGRTSVDRRTSVTQLKVCFAAPAHDTVQSVHEVDRPTVEQIPEILLLGQVSCDGSDLTLLVLERDWDPRGADVRQDDVEGRVLVQKGEKKSLPNETTGAGDDDGLWKKKSTIS